MKVKVCGMKNNVAEVAGLKPDYLGFIFWKGSPRYFTGRIPVLADGIAKVGVFVDAPPDFVIETVERHNLPLIQLHGSESHAYCAALREKFLVAQPGPSAHKIIKAFSIRDPFDFDKLHAYEPFCDYFLFDTKGELPGGNGVAFDWTLLSGYPSETPFFLSGGIGPDELPQLHSFLHRPEAKLCHAIDVNSRFEREPGFKITEILEPFIREIQSAKINT